MCQKGQGGVCEGEIMHCEKSEQGVVNNIRSDFESSISRNKRLFGWRGWRKIFFSS